MITTSSKQTFKRCRTRLEQQWKTPRTRRTRSYIESSIGTAVHSSSVSEKGDGDRLTKMISWNVLSLEESVDTNSMRIMDFNDLSKGERYYSILQ